MPKGFIFDYGGTIDTRGCHWGKKIWHAYQNLQVPVSEENYRQAYVYAERMLGRNPIIQSSYTFKKTLEVKLRIQMDYLSDNHLFYEECISSKMVANLLTTIYEDVCKTVADSKKVLEALAKKYPISLVSNFYGNIEVVLEEFGLSKLFKHVIESAVVGVRKPDPHIFTLGVESLDLQPADVVVVGDSFTKDILPAVKAGCKAVWIKGEGWTDEDFDETIPENVICSLEELLNLY